MQYAYLKNLQGDVTHIIDIDNEEVAVSYVYDPWGNPTVFGDEEIAAINPCSYRGYYFDGETGWYYLQSRYYNPETGRFLNADDAEYIDSDDFIGNNIFLYCNNNSVNGVDNNGHLVMSIAATLIVITTLTILAIVNLLLTVYSPTYRENVNRTIDSLLNSAFITKLVSAISTIVKTANSSRRYTSNEKHHIIARNHHLAVPAKTIWTSHSLSIDAGINKISIKKTFHKHIHTALYFTAINCMISTGNRVGKKYGVIAALCIARAIIYLANKVVR